MGDFGSFVQKKAEMGCKLDARVTLGERSVLPSYFQNIFVLNATVSNHAGDFNANQYTAEPQSSSSEDV